MSVLITGGSGVLGIHLVASFAAAGHDVVSLSISGAPAGALEYIGETKGRVVFAEGDILDKGLLVDLAREHDIEGVVHSAARTGEAQARAHPYDVFRTNVLGTLHVYETGRELGMGRIIHLGSGSEYGQREDLRPIKEEELQVEGFYAETKYIGARLAERYRAVFGLDAVTARVSSVYGPYTRFAALRGLVGNTLIAHLCRAVARREPIEISGGDYPRGWTYAADAAEGIRLLYEKDTLAHQAFNVASGMLYSVREVAEALRRLEPDAQIGVSGGRFDDDEFQAGNLHGPLDVTRLRNEVGFVPRFSLEEGLRAYLDWWQEMLPREEELDRTNRRYLVPDSW